MVKTTTQFSTIEFVYKNLKKNSYLDVRLYYTQRGDKYRPSTGVRLNPKYLLKSGKISSSHPEFVEISEVIKIKHEQLESLIESYINEHREKPPGEMVENCLRRTGKKPPASTGTRT